jgi:DNA-binding YbaB/EbfC family protein
MDLKRMMSQLQNQSAMLQKKMESLEITGEAGGENGVIILMNGKFQVKDIKIKFLPSEESDLEILEDLIKKALGSCYEQIEKEIKKYTGGMF